MNYLAIFKKELVDGDRVVLTSERARYAIEVHALKEGLTCSVVVIGRGRKKAYVETVSEDQIVLLLDNSEEFLEQDPIELIVAIPRPQTLRKVLQISATFGVKCLHLIRSEKVVKSYLTSKRLEQDAILEDLLLGIEQSGSVFFPEVMIHQRFSQFIEDVLPLRTAQYENTVKVIADTHKEQTVSLLDLDFCQGRQGIFIAIGPESGWNNYEVDRFQENGFSLITLGKRIFRVETACTGILSQIQLLRSK